MGVKVVVVVNKAGSKFKFQLKIKPLSEDRLSVIIIDQSPFIGQPSKPIKGSVDSYVPAGRVPPVLSDQVPLFAAGDQQ